MSTLTVVLIAIVAIALVFAVFMIVRKERSKKLRGRFGPEYDRLVRDSGSQRIAEDELAKRQKRIEKLPLRELDRREVERFAASWKAVQTQFVDAPRDAVTQADRLVRDAMAARGYPVTDFEQRAADISVDHPHVVENYRAAHGIAVRDAAGTATTEDLRQAMVHYRALFEDLLDQSLHRVNRPMEVIR
jgi:FtsZ-interacting cell division protein ZipA